jgi:hypothetical protein
MIKESESPHDSLARASAALRSEKEVLHITRTRSLYMPYGNLPHSVRLRNNLPAHSNVVFHWFCVGRKEPISDYKNLILGYNHLSPSVRDLSQSLVDEMLTDEEFHQLKSYLMRRHGADTRTTLVTAPVFATRSRSSSKSESRPFLPGSLAAGTTDGAATPATPGTATFIESNTSGFYPLSLEEGYDLPFAVWGFYGSAGTTRA